MKVERRSKIVSVQLAAPTADEEMAAEAEDIVEHMVLDDESPAKKLHPS